MFAILNKFNHSLRKLLVQIFGGQVCLVIYPYVYGGTIKLQKKQREGNRDISLLLTTFFLIAKKNENPNKIWPSNFHLTLHYKYNFLLLTYPSFVDISSVLYKQPNNIRVTILCCCSEWSFLQHVGKKKIREGTLIYKAHILFRNDQRLDICLNLRLRRLHSVGAT